jgi:hydrogenase/urease accessory protein HupE
VPAPLFRIAMMIALVLVALWPATTAQAHVRETMGYSTVTANGRQVNYLLELEYEVLARTVDLGPDAAAAADDAARARALEAGTGALTAYLGERLRVFLDGAACEMTLVGTSPGRRGEAPYAQLQLSYACPGESGAHRIEYHVFGEDEAVVEDHSNVVDYDLGGHRGQTVLDRQHPDLTVGSTSVWSSVLRFGATGVEHILLGADHVLFVIALILGSTGRRQLVGILSTFTLAHSVTLISALLGVVSAPAEVVEPLIALSIAFVALENLLGATAHRYPVVFVFGLLHGLGFAGSLRVSDEVGWDLVVSLLSFNVGIEVGQALLAAAAVPLVLLVRHLAVGQAVVRGATVLVALFGIGWFIERIALA